MTPAGRALHEVLWQANSDLRDAARRHPFIGGLEGGSLPEEAFKEYVARDAFFLRAFARAYALAAARCEGLEDMGTLHRLLGGVLEECELHRTYARRLGIDLEAVRPSRETLAYTHFLERTAWCCALGEILAAVTPCMKLHAYLGGELAAGGLPEHRYRAWVETYASREFAELVAEIEALLDRHGTDSEPVREAYRHALLCELDVFSAALAAHAAPRPAGAG